MGKRVITREQRPERYGSFNTAYLKNSKIILASRDICGICGKPVDKSYKFPHPLAPTIDHIIPVSKGGHPSDIENLQLAHFCCNRQKSDKLQAERKSGTITQDVITNRNLPQHFDWSAYKCVNV